MRPKSVDLLVRFDRPKTVAIHWRRNGEVTEWNLRFAYAALELGVGVELCWPYRPQEKGSVENLVKVRRFRDETDLAEQLAEWLKEVNEERPCRATNVIPALRWFPESAGADSRNADMSIQFAPAPGSVASPLASPRSSAASSTPGDSRRYAV